MKLLHVKKDNKEYSYNETKKYLIVMTNTIVSPELKKRRLRQMSVETTKDKIIDFVLLLGATGVVVGAIWAFYNALLILF